ncbi:MAG: hypothetical protein C5B50_12665 [Verrucomicrobia bacterium]|nr:MAG: hypothetical protein C5B50_12665 [Verrucomicrobiota bacterium]
MPTRSSRANRALIFSTVLTFLSFNKRKQREQRFFLSFLSFLLFTAPGISGFGFRTSDFAFSLSPFPPFSRLERWKA